MAVLHRTNSPVDILENENENNDNLEHIRIQCFDQLNSLYHNNLRKNETNTNSLYLYSISESCMKFYFTPLKNAEENIMKFNQEATSCCDKMLSVEDILSIPEFNKSKNPSCTNSKLNVRNSYTVFNVIMPHKNSIDYLELKEEEEEEEDNLNSSDIPKIQNDNLPTIDNSLEPTTSDDFGLSELISLLKPNGAGESTNLEDCNTSVIKELENVYDKEAERFNLPKCKPALLKDLLCNILTNNLSERVAKLESISNSVLHLEPKPSYHNVHHKPISSLQKSAYNKKDEKLEDGSHKVGKSYIKKSFAAATNVMAQDILNSVIHLQK